MIMTGLLDILAQIKQTNPNITFNSYFLLSHSLLKKKVPSGCRNNVHLLPHIILDRLLNSMTFSFNFDKCKLF